MESNSFKNPDNDIFKQGKSLVEELVIPDLMTTLMMNLFQAYEGVAKMIDLNPPAYSKLWEITKRVQTMRESNGPGPGDFIDRINELNRRVINGEFPSLSSDQVTGQVFVIRIEENYARYFTFRE